MSEPADFAPLKNLTRSLQIGLKGLSWFWKKPSSKSMEYLNVLTSLENGSLKVSMQCGTSLHRNEVELDTHHVLQGVKE